MNRRVFLSLGAAGAIGLAGGTRRVSAQPQAQAPVPVAGDDIPLGQSRLGIADGPRDGSVYVPRSYQKGTPMPVLKIGRAHV